MYKSVHMCAYVYVCVCEVCVSTHLCRYRRCGVSFCTCVLCVYTCVCVCGCVCMCACIVRAYVYMYEKYIMDVSIWLPHLLICKLTETRE